MPIFEHPSFQRFTREDCNSHASSPGCSCTFYHRRPGSHGSGSSYYQDGAACRADTSHETPERLLLVVPLHERNELLMEASYL